MINRRVASLVYLMNAMQGLKTKGSFIATQLNSTSSWVELRRQSVYSDADATQRNSDLKADDASELNWTQLDVELSWVASL